MDRNRARRTERYAQFSIATSRLALEDAGIDPSAEDPDRAGVLMGSALGGVAYGEDQFTSYVHKGVRGVDPMLALAVFNGAASCNVAIEFGFTAPNSTNGMSCASGAIAIGDAWRAIRAGGCGRRAGGRRGDAAGAAVLRRVRHHPRHVHAQQRSGARLAPLRRARATAS